MHAALNSWLLTALLALGCWCAWRAAKFFKDARGFLSQVNSAKWNFHELSHRMLEIANQWQAIGRLGLRLAQEGEKEAYREGVIYSIASSMLKAFFGGRGPGALPPIGGSR